MRVDQSRLSASGRADDEDVLSRAHSGADYVPVLQTAHAIEKIIPAAKMIERVVTVGQDSVGFVVIKTEDLPRAQTNGEHRPSDDWRHDALEAAAIDGQFRFEDRMFMIQNRSRARLRWFRARSRLEPRASRQSWKTRVPSVSPTASRQD